jgi:hypothetical protein
MMALSRQAVFRLAGMGEYDCGIMPIRYLMEMANYLLSSRLIPGRPIRAGIRP